jgi:hypothetical protein
MRILYIFFVLLVGCNASANVIGYLTDLEGSAEKLMAYYASSPEIFYLGDDGDYHIRENATFVYGGDAMDRFYGNIFIINEFDRFLQETPEQFVMIAGNRDINKFRIPVELNDLALQQPPVEVTIRSEEDAIAFKESSQIFGNRIQRLKYMLRHNMGAPDKFELLKRELEELRGQTPTDSEVTSFYFDWLQPGGQAFYVLSRMKLIHRVGNTLFVHGGITAENFGRLPHRSGVVSDLDQWIEKLNNFYTDEVLKIAVNGNTWPGPSEDRVGDLLLEYPMPRPWETDRSRMDSVVTGRNIDAFINPLDLPPVVRAYLKQSGIARVVVGHNPVGQYPILVRPSADSVEQLYGDNSHSGNNSVSAAVIIGGRNLENLHVRGTARVDGVSHSLTTHTTVGKPSLLGKAFADGRRVIGQLSNSDYFSTLLHFIEFNNQLHPASSFSCGQIMGTQGL